MHAAFQQAAVPEPFRVLGRNLRQYTIGHQLLLERFDSGYAVGSKNPPSWDDFAFSVWICSQTYQQVLAALSSRLLLLRVRAWSARCGLFDVQEAQSFFQRYLESNRSEPVYFVEESAKSGDEIGIPWGVYLKHHTQERLHLTESQVVEHPYIDAQLLYLRHLQERGMIQFATGLQLEMMEAARKVACN